MPLRYPYADAYLAPLVTQAREDQAAAEVAMLGTLPTDWVARLTVLRAYMITCTESMKSSDDVFAAKLAAYRKDYTETIGPARAAQAAADSAAGKLPVGAGSVFSVSLDRA